MTTIRLSIPVSPRLRFGNKIPWCVDNNSLPGGTADMVRQAKQARVLVIELKGR
jgi:hypothetical protein